MSQIFGFIPARMEASRFPGKPLHLIAGKPMLQHVFERASGFADWNTLTVATCDEEISDFCANAGYPWIMTSLGHTRAIDRCAEAASKLVVDPDDIVVVVQGDEPLLTADMIRAVVAPIVGSPVLDSRGRQRVTCTLLAMPIHDAEQFNNPDIVKVVTDSDDLVLYTSREPIPHLPSGVEFTPEHGAKRIGGIFAFRKHALDWFIAQEQHFLELAESCDSNRILGNGRHQKCVTVPCRHYYSVDRLEDVERVEKALVVEGAAIPADGVLDRHIFINIDRELTQRIEHIRDLVGQNKSVVIWSSNGAAYARAFASEHGLLEFVIAIGKPEMLVGPPINVPIVAAADFFA